MADGLRPSRPVGHSTETETDARSPVESSITQAGSCAVLRLMVLCIVRINQRANAEQNKEQGENGYGYCDHVCLHHANSIGGRRPARINLRDDSGSTRGRTFHHGAQRRPPSNPGRRASSHNYSTYTFMKQPLITEEDYGVDFFLFSSPLDHLHPCFFRVFRGQPLFIPVLLFSSYLSCLSC